jgi:hypothetical protein
MEIFSSEGFVFWLVVTPLLIFIFTKLYDDEV